MGNVDQKIARALGLCSATVSLEAGDKELVQGLLLDALAELRQKRRKQVGRRKMPISAQTCTRESPTARSSRFD